MKATTDRQCQTMRILNIEKKEKKRGRIFFQYFFLPVYGSGREKRQMRAIFFILVRKGLDSRTKVKVREKGQIPEREAALDWMRLRPSAYTLRT